MKLGLNIVIENKKGKKVSSFLINGKFNTLPINHIIKDLKNASIKVLSEKENHIGTEIIIKLST